MKTLIDRVHVLTMDDAYTAYPQGWVLTEDDRIAQAGSGPAPAADQVIDGRGGLLLPGFVNLHCHAAMVPFRSLGDDCPDRLRRFLFPLENEALTPALTRAAARYGMAEMLLAGVTAFVDMYYFEDQVAEACEESGIRGYLGETVISQRSPDAPDSGAGLRLTRDFIRRWRGSGCVRPVVAPHGTTTVSPDALRRCGELAAEEDCLLTLHVSEMDYEMAHFAAQGTTPLGFLDSLGLVGPRLLAAHCIHLSPEDIALLADRNASVAHCIGSNTKAGKGVAPVRELAAAGVRWGLGTDGPASGNTLSLFDQMRLFAVCHKTANRDRSLFPAREIVRAATRGGAEALGAGDEFGQIRPGMQADLTLVSTDSAPLFPIFDPYAALVYAASARDVSLTMAAGRILVRDGQLQGESLDSLRSALAARMDAFSRAALRRSREGAANPPETL